MIKQFLKSEVVPALGCTEPVCVALACAHAGFLIPERKIKRIDLIVSRGIFKNGMGVYLPGTNLKGLYIAAAIGAFYGDPKRDLEVFSDLDPKEIERVVEFVEAGKVNIDIDYDKSGIFVHAVVFGDEDRAESIIKDFHNKLVMLKKNNEDVHFESQYESWNKTNIDAIIKWIKDKSCSELIDLIYELDYEDFEFLKKGVMLNVELVSRGLKKEYGYGVGPLFKDFYGKEREPLIINEVQKNVAAAVDARMGGVFLPAMSSAGSGNNGLVATIPVWTVHEILNTREVDFLRAVALSHLFTSKLKAHMGRITPICSCALSAGGGASAGVCYLYNKEKQYILNAVETHIVSLFGIICDGAKPGCSIKLLTAAYSAIQSVFFALKGKSLFREEGLLGNDIDQTLKNLEQLTSKGYANTDSFVIEVMKNKGIK